MTYNFEIDTVWCLEELLKAHRISERDKLLVQTTQRNKQQMKWHPLQWIAHFGLKDQQHPTQNIDLLCLSRWLAEKSGLAFYLIDPLKADVNALTAVMSQEFAERNQILAVEVHADRVVIGTDQPFQTDWLANLERSLAPKKIERVIISPDQLQRYLPEYYQVSRAVHSSKTVRVMSVRTRALRRCFKLAIRKIQMPTISTSSNWSTGFYSLHLNKVPVIFI